MKNFIKNSKIQHLISLSLVLTIAFALVFSIAEPTMTFAVTDQIIVTQLVTSGISIDSPADVSMSRAITTSANNATGSAVWTVITNNQSGYTLSVNAEINGACSGKALCDPSKSEAFSDLSTTKAAWSVTTDYAFGFSARGNDVTGWGTDTDCIGGGADTPSATLSYRGFAGPTLVQIASSTSETGTAGTATTICFAAEQNGVFAPSGTYYATTTATAVIQ